MRKDEIKRRLRAIERESRAAFESYELYSHPNDDPEYERTSLHPQARIARSIIQDQNRLDQEKIQLQAELHAISRAEKRAGESRSTSTTSRGVALYPYGDTNASSIHLPRLVRVRGGNFWMGSQRPAYSSEQPRHMLTVETFYLGMYPITNEEFNAVETLKTQVSKEFDSDYVAEGSYPVSNVTWIQAANYCYKLGQITGLAFRLPSEAEWEYAAKSGRDFEYPTATGMISPEVANFSNSVGHLTPVDHYEPNPFGLCDMAGNVWEWCSSKKGDYHKGICRRAYDYPYERKDGREDLSLSGASRILRGGCYTSKAIHCRSAARYREFEHRSSNYHPSRGENTFGFRIALSK